MQAKASVIAQRLLNLYRQEHVIFGGWAAINPIFVADAADDVIEELRQMPTGKMLIRHIENLRSGKTPMDSIERDLLPYGGLMTDTMATISLTASQWAELESGINNFTPDEAGLAAIKNLAVIRQFGDEWPVAIRAALKAKPHLLEKWNAVTQTHRAYYLWNVASEIITEPLTERARAQVQADMPEYETYLPMFGAAGTELLSKLRLEISNIKPASQSDDDAWPTESV